MNKKKITVLIPVDTFNILDSYCRNYSGRKTIYYRHVINNAILDYCKKNTVNFCSKNTVLEENKDNYSYFYIKECLEDYFNSDNCDDDKLLYLFASFDNRIRELYDVYIDDELNVYLDKGKCENSKLNIIFDKLKFNIFYKLSKMEGS